jgi:site-specific recombinase XerD
MTPLRAKFIRDLVVRGRSKNTQEAYTRYVRDLARYYRRSPELISYEEVTDWVYHLITERLLSASSVNVALNAVCFLYAVTLGRETVDLMASVPHMKRYTWLFLGKKAGQPMGRYAGQSIYYSALKKSGVRRMGGIHLLRHSFATHLMESGVELPVVQHLLGHSSLRTTALYLHVTARRLAEVRSPLDLIGSGCLGQ